MDKKRKIAFKQTDIRKATVYGIFLLLLTISLLSFGCKSQSKTTSNTNIRTVTISAHRGGPLEGYPENALETLQNTSNMVDGIMMEIDVLPTRDSVLVLMHDKTLDRTSTLKGYVKDYTLEEIKKGFLVDGNQEKTKFRVPTLRTVFEWLKAKNAFLSIDVKDKTTFRQVIDLIREYKVLDKTEVITYSLRDAESVHQYDSEINLSVSLGSSTVFEKLLGSDINISKVSAFTGLALKDTLFYQKLKQKGIVVTLGTIGNLDNRAKARGYQLFNEWTKLGIDRFATDNYIPVHKALILK